MEKRVCRHFFDNWPI